jgi:tetratricopeptide (TPR) repeat protein
MDHKKSIKTGFTCFILCLMGLCLVPLVAADDSGAGYYDWKWYTTDHIGEYNKAQAGSSYAGVTIYIKNEGDKAISPNPLDWYLLIGGLKYSYDSATFDSSINHLTYDVMKGGETETIIVYLVKGNPSTATLKYDQLFGPELKHIDHYILSQSGKSDEAIKAFDKAIEINPQYADAWYNTDKGGRF